LKRLTYAGYGSLSQLEELTERFNDLSLAFSRSMLIGGWSSVAGALQGAGLNEPSSCDAQLGNAITWPGIKTA